MGSRSFHPCWGWSLPTRGTTSHPQADRSHGPSFPMRTLAGGLDTGTNRPFGLNSQYRSSGPLPPARAAGKNAVAPGSADPRVWRRRVGRDCSLPRLPGRTAGTHVKGYPHPPLPSPYPAPVLTTCGWFPGAATLLCRTLPAGGPCDMPRAHHTGRPERGALLPALRPHPRTCRPAPPLPALRAPPRPPPHPARPVLSRLRPLLLPRPRFLLSPPPRRTSGSRIPPKLLFSARGPRASWKSRGSSEAHPRERTPGGWGRGAGEAQPPESSGRSRGVRVRSTSEWLPCPSAGHRRWGTFFRATRHLDRFTPSAIPGQRAP